MRSDQARNAQGQLLDEEGKEAPAGSHGDAGMQ